MKSIQTILLSLSLALIIFSSASAQPTGRTFGARRITLDNSDNILANNVYLIDRSGTLGIDNVGQITLSFPNTCALLDINSTTKGVLLPRMTKAQELAICGGLPPEGLMVYNTTTHSNDFFNGAGYTSPWVTKGNYGTDPLTDFIGTFDATDLVFRTNSIERARIFSTGNVSIGTAAAASHLQVNETGAQEAFNSNTTGSGRAGSFAINNVGNSSTALNVSTTGSGTGLNVSSTGAGTGLNITTPNSNNLLVVNGAANATVLNVAADPVWDSRIIGDQLVTGVQKVGGSIWLDGNSATHQIVANAPINIGTRTNNTVALVSNNVARLSIDGSGNTTIAGGNTTINGGGSVTMNIGSTFINEGSGQFHLNATPAAGGQYAMEINTTGHAGLSIHCNEQTGTNLTSTTHFADFYDGKVGGGWRGSIQGQNLGELLVDPVFVANAAFDAANGTLGIAVVAGGVCATLAAGLPTEAPLAACTVAGFVAQGLQIVAAQLQYTTLVGIQEGNLGVAYQSSAGDYAEYLKREDPSVKLYPGDIVGMKNGMISKNTEGAQSVFSISLAPIVLGNVPEKDHEADYNKVGFLGQVPVKVRGVVKEGDFIIASGLNDGIGIAVSAEKITPEQFTMIVGRSWTSSAFEGIKYVKAAVGLNAKAMSEVMAHQQEQINALSNEVKELRRSQAEVASMKAKLDRLEQYIGSSKPTTKEVLLRTN